MQLFYRETPLPKIELSSVIPKGHGTTFIITFGKKEYAGGEFLQPAKILAEHIDIIAESRRIIEEGKTVAWEEFYNTHAQKRRK